MSMTHPVGDPVLALAGALEGLGGTNGHLRLVETPLAPPRLTAGCRKSHPERWESLSVDRALTERARATAEAPLTIVVTSVGELLGLGFGPLWSLGSGESNPVHLVAAGGIAGGPGPESLDDLSVLRGVPRLTVVAPADAPTTATALGVLTDTPGPSYLRLPATSPIPTVTDGRFELGRAAELRSGSDLTVGAVGRLVATALEVAAELARVGIAARVLDFASVKPFDTKAVVRAARETGAILTLEEHQAATGIGSLVAALTAENYPVPVRRLGVPDLAGEPPGTEAEELDRLGLGVSRALEEAWELLRLRGKVQ
jgi:transketolase